MELRQIAYVLEVARRGNFSRAAEALFVTQPTVSQQIHALEKELGTTLFSRDTHRVYLTVDGTRFCSYAEKIMQNVNELKQAFDRGRAESETVINVGIFPFYLVTKLSGLLTSYYSEHAQLHGGIIKDDNYKIYDLLVKEKVNFAVLKIHPGEELNSFNYERLAREPMVVLMNRNSPLAKRKSVNLRLLSQMPLLTGEAGTYYYMTMRERFERADMPFQPAMQNAPDAGLIMTMLRGGHGYTFTTEEVAKAVSDEYITGVPLEPKEVMDVCLVYLRGKHPNAAERSFMNTIRNAYLGDLDYREEQP